MRRDALALFMLTLFLAACAGQPDQTLPKTAMPQSTQAAVTPSQEPTLPEPDPTATVAPTVVEPLPETEDQEVAPVSYPPFDGDPLPSERGQYFSGSGACSLCHTRMVDADGEDVSIDSYWRSTMMANAARDPYWLASVRSESLSNPGLESDIEDKCATCHMPMARTTSEITDEPGLILDVGYIEPERPFHTLAMDGVSCTLCHQIESANLGTDESFSGGFTVDPDLPAGERLNYGPYVMMPGPSAVMQSASGFIPIQGEHIQESELCATCHTLITPTISSDGEITGQFPEQMTYFEWLNSDYAQNSSCQDCHMPVAPGGIQLSITGGRPRQPFSKHSFVGGNAYMLGILRAFGPELGVTSSSVQLDATIDRVTSQLQTISAGVAIEDLRISGDRLEADIKVDDMTGHKFPTGFPSRRVWLHMTVLDPGGEVIFESGGWTAEGLIEGNENDLDASRFEPHYQVINDPSQVQIYEAILQDGDGLLTSELLRANQYIKDNRLLPDGFEIDPDKPEIMIYGSAAEDKNFVGGSDLVSYEVALDGVDGPYRVQVELLYQSIGYRWATNLIRFSAQEIEQFSGYYAVHPNAPVVISQASAEIE